MEEGLIQGVPERLAARRERLAGQLWQPKTCKILVGTSAPSDWCQVSTGSNALRNRHAAHQERRLIHPSCGATCTSWLAAGTDSAHIRICYAVLLSVRSSIFRTLSTFHITERHINCIKSQPAPRRSDPFNKFHDSPAHFSDSGSAPGSAHPSVCAVSHPSRFSPGASASR